MRRTELENILDSLVAYCASIEQENSSPLYEMWDNTGIDAGWGWVGIIVKKIWAQSINVPEVRQELQGKVRDICKKLIEIHEFYIAAEFYEMTEQDDREIYEYSQKNTMYIEGAQHYDLMLAMQKHGNPTEVDTVLALNRVDTGGYESCREQVENVRKRITALQRAYIKKNLLPNKRGFESRLLPTAALQLKEDKYDLALGILKSGAPLINYLQVVEQNSGFIDFHRDWINRNAILRTKKTSMAIRKQM